MKRVQELEPHRTNHTRGQHLVSQVVLKQFAVHSLKAGRQLCSFDLTHPDRAPALKGPNGCGKVLDFIGYASVSAESLWGEVERRLPGALKAIERGDVLDHPAHVATIKDAMALHFIRAKHSRIVHTTSWERVKADFRAALLERPELLDRVHYSKTGLYAAGTEARNALIDDLQAPMQAQFDSDALFRAGLEKRFEDTQRLLAPWGVEVIKSRVGEFLIGDIPAVTVRHDQTQVGVLGGIAIGDAHALVLPLSRRYCIALGPYDRLDHVDQRIVDQLNTYQVRAAQKYVYFSPRSDLERFVREQLAHTRPSVEVQKSGNLPSRIREVRGTATSGAWNGPA